MPPKVKIATPVEEPFDCARIERTQNGYLITFNDRFCEGDDTKKRYSYETFASMVEKLKGVLCRVK